MIRLEFNNLIAVVFWGYLKYIILSLRRIAYLIIHDAILVDISLFRVMTMTIQAKHQFRKVLGIVIKYLCHIIIKLLCIRSGMHTTVRSNSSARLVTSSSM